MKSLCALLVLTCAVFVAARPETATFTTKYDNTNLKEILENKRLFDNYVKCILDEPKGSKCTPDAKELKVSIPKAMENDCKGCNQKQKEMTEFVIKYVYEHYHEVFLKFLAKFDPTGEYAKKWEKTAKEHNIDLSKKN